jgi:hypothetical protein
MDRGLLEFLGPQGFGVVIYSYTSKINQISLGFVFYYLFLLLGGLVLFLGFFTGWAYLIPFLDVRLFILLILVIFFLLF